MFEDDSLDFQEEIQQIIDEEVEKRVKLAIEDYQNAIKVNEELTKENRKIRLDNQDLTHKLQHASTKSFKEGLDKATREILGGFKIDDSVWVSKREVTWYKCITCSGAGNVTATFNEENIEIRCPRCHGGRTSTVKLVPIKGTIKELHYQVWYHGEQVRRKFYVDCGSSSSMEINDVNNIFKTKEECEAHIESLNKQEMK